MVKIASLLTAALFGAVAMTMPIAQDNKLAERGVVVVTVYQTVVAVPTPVVKDVVVDTVYETVYARPASAANPVVVPQVVVTAVPSAIPHKPQQATTTAAPQTTAAPPPPPPAATSSAPVQPPTSGGSWESDMLSQLNAVRASAGKAPLTLNSQLNSMAEEHSQYMSSTNDMTHTDPNGSLGTRFGAAGIPWMGAAENIAWNQKTVTEVMQAWTNSPGHYANMIGDYTSVGFGQVNYYWTQDFVKN
ncbi:hypothetical protein IWW38_000612 [Coemansia aciculifera]|uniref:Uncharacterized protein n=1 Tax=Coemansia aciculifera TaxID=417176 RepID=A0ACC1M8P4_9FUNG|nr:hypothetical protein IWW38_000612 [Coemansia aciculifera]